MSERRFRLGIAGILAVGLSVRLGYLLAQPGHDPAFAYPMLDGAYYVDWARALLAGNPGPEGAFYLAPLYPYLLVPLLSVLGPGLGGIFAVQQVAGVLTAGLLGVSCRRRLGESAGLVCAALFLLYHPILFFASCPVGESVALLLMASGLVAAGRGPGGNVIAGLAWGAMSLARPNLLLIPVAWSVARVVSRRWRDAAIPLLAVAVVILPVALRNLVVSGHLVPVSSNGGITLYHGNGPGAEGTFTLASGFTGSVLDQRREATVLASSRTRRELDAVDADRWWGRAAIRARMDAPAESVALFARKAILLVGNREISLDYAPAIDDNPWRYAAPVPFALLLALSAAGVMLRGLRKSGGADVWGPIAAAAVTPVLFYFSSRYRLPVAALLCIPAAAGAVTLLEGWKRGPSRRTWVASAVGAVVLVASLVASPASLVVESRATSLANRAVSWKQAGNLARAEVDLRRALAIEADSVPALYNLGVVLDAGQRPAEAEEAYARVLRLDPSHAEAAGNLAGHLVRTGRGAEAVEPLRRALASRPDHRVCWTNLVVALMSTGRRDDARAAALEALEREVSLDPALLDAVGVAGEER